MTKRHVRAEWRSILETIVTTAGDAVQRAESSMRRYRCSRSRPPMPMRLAAHLAANDPPIHCGLGRRHEGVLLFSPVSLTIEQAAIIGRRLRQF